MAQLSVSSEEPKEYRVIKANLPRLIDKVFPEDVSDHLYSLGIISEDIYVTLFDRSSTRKDRSRKLIKAVLDAVATDKSVFQKFCSVLLETNKKSISDLARQLQGDLDAALANEVSMQDESTGEPKIAKSLPSLIQLKQELELLRKSLLQSDENVDAKQSLIKEFIARFIRNSLESGEENLSIHSSLEKLCTVDMLVPQTLQEWCFAELDKQYSIHSQQNVPMTCEDVSNAGPPPLFSKSNVYHALYVSTAVFSCNSQNYESHFLKNPHEFDEVSMSEDFQSENKIIERYLLARKNRTLFVAFNGEPNLYSWQRKYQTLNQGITIQQERIPIRFFVECLRNESYQQLIFTGFSFGASLASAVHAELWNQTCLEIRDLEENVAFIGFGAPLFTISSIQQTITDHSELQYNARLFYLEDDLLPRLFQCADFSKPDDEPYASSSASTNMLYSGTISGNALESLSQIQHNSNRKTPKPLSDDLVKSLKTSLQAAIPSTQVKVPVYGQVCNVYHDKDVIKISEPLADSDHLKYPNSSLIESMDSNDLYNKHSIDHYQSAISNSLLQSSIVSNEPLYSSSKQSLPLKKLEFLKPEVAKAKFFRHADEIAIVLEGVNLWFCHQIRVGDSRKEAKITINPKGQETTNRSIIFNYIPKKENDLLIDHKSSQVTITLYSHFCKSITKYDIPAEKMDDYTISFRQRQLAKLTPLEVIRLSLLSAMLEKSSNTRSSPNASPSSEHFKAICQFLEDVTRIVPVESICDAIESESKENAWKCAEALFDSQFIPPKPSLLFRESLQYGLIRLKSGIPSSVFQSAATAAAKKLYDERRGNESFPIQSTIAVSSDQREVVVTAVKGRTRTTVESDEHGVPLLKQEVVFDNPVYTRSFSDVVRGRQHSICFPIPEPTYLAGSKHDKIMQYMQYVLMYTTEKLREKRRFNVICDSNIAELYPSKGNQQKSSCLKPPIDFLKETKMKLAELQTKSQKELSDVFVLDDTDSRKEDINHYNEEMIQILEQIMSQDVAICLSLLGAFIQQQIQVPFVNSLSETAHVLQTAESSSAVGVWTLFCLDMLDLQRLLNSRKGKLHIEVAKYVEGILRQRDSNSQKRRSSPDRGGYAGKLQFLMVSMGEIVSCNSQYISYSLERQLIKLCKRYKIKPSTRVDHIIETWDKKFAKSILLYVMPQFRSLLARWLLWSLNIHKLREELASHTTVGIVGLSNSGKSCLVKKLFNQEAISGTSRVQRTTIPFIYNLEGLVDGLSIADFPGVDDKDKSVVNISKIILQLSQIVILVIDYRRISTKSAMEWIEQLDKSGVPVLLCLTHGDRLYVEKCSNYNYTIDKAKRIIGREFEDIKKPLSTCPSRTVILCSFHQDRDSRTLNCKEGRRILSEIGIVSQDYVGTWLVDNLKFQKQIEIANRLHEFLTTDYDDGDNLDTVSKKSLSLEMKMPMLCGVTEYAEKAIEISKIDSEYQYVDWKEYGIKITIPPSALEKGINYTIALKAVDINPKNYKLPPNSEVVSAFFWVFSSCKFLKPVDLRINHCARLEDKSALSRMSVISAQCDQALPYQFHKCSTAEFQLQSREGQISTRQFSIITIIRDWLHVLLGNEKEVVVPPHETYYVYMIFGRKQKKLRNVWQFDFCFMKDIEAIKEKIDKNHLRDNWIEDTPATVFDFEEETDNVAITLPQNEEFSDWKIRLKPCDKITKNSIDSSFETTTQQYCRIAFQWMGGGTPRPIDYTITLKGVVIGTSTPKVELSVPIDLLEEGSTPVVTVPAHPPVLPPIIIENKPTVTVNPTINIES